MMNKFESQECRIKIGFEQKQVNFLWFLQIRMLRDFQSVQLLFKYVSIKF